MDIKVIQQLPDKTVIDSFTGVITKVWDFKKDVGEHKSTQQNLVVNCSGVGVNVTLWNQPEVAKEKTGQTITAACAHGRNSNPIGLTKTSYKDALQISISGKCLVQIGEVLLEEPSDPALLERYKALHEPAKAPLAPVSTQAQPGSYQPQTPSEDVNGSARIVVMNAKKAAAQMGALYMVAIDRVKRIVDWAESRGFKVPPENACAWATTIAMSMKDKGLSASMPVDKPVHDYVSSIGDWGHGADRAQVQEAPTWMTPPAGPHGGSQAVAQREPDDDLPF